MSQILAGTSRGLFSALLSTTAPQPWIPPWMRPYAGMTNTEMVFDEAAELSVEMVEAAAAALREYREDEIRDGWIYAL